MLPTVKFLNATNVVATGVGVKRDDADWHYYLPFKSFGRGADQIRDCQACFALPLSDDLLVVATRHGNLALIDLDAEEVVARAQISQTLSDLQLSANGRYLFAQDRNHLHVLDAKTLAIIQFWYLLERTDAGWVRYRADEPRDVVKSRFDKGELARLHLFKPVNQIDERRLASAFLANEYDNERKRFVERSGSYVLDIVTGGVEFHDDADAPYKLRQGIWSLSGPILAQKANGPTWSSDCPAFDALVADETAITIIATGDRREAAIAALDDLAQRMERDLNALVCCDTIAIRFLLNDDAIDAAALFDRVAQEKWAEAAPVLRRILLAYLNGIGGGEGDMPWHYQGQSMRALRALMLLDRDALDVYRLYLAKGDLGHDHAPYDFYVEYVCRHGIRNEADVRFGVYLTLMGFLDTDADPVVVLEAAEGLMTPERFADIVVEEAGHRGDDFWERRGEDYVRLLATGPDTDFTRAVTDILESRI